MPSFITIPRIIIGLIIVALFTWAKVATSAKDAAIAERDSYKLQLDQGKALSDALEAKLAVTDKKIKELQVVTSKKSIEIANAKIGDTCEDAMNYLRQFGRDYANKAR